MNAKKNNQSTFRFLESVSQVLLATGGTINELNVRQSAASMGCLFSALADAMDAIYGPNSFALTAELRDWSQAFIAGDCDGKLALGDLQQMLLANLNVCWHSFACALSTGDDVHAVAADFIQKKHDESGI